MKKICFVFGTARSGTSALVHVLNTHPALLIGMERYYHLIENRSLQAQHFEKSRFIESQPGDSHTGGFSLPAAARAAAFDRAEFVGDKYPNLFKFYDDIVKKFPDALYIYIIRNPLSVLESYDVRANDVHDSWIHPFQTGMIDWNASVRHASTLKEGVSNKIIFVEYERLFSSAHQINSLFSKIGLDPLPDDKIEKFVHKFQSLQEGLVKRRDDIRAFAARNADWVAYREVLKRCDECII